MSSGGHCLNVVHSGGVNLSFLGRRQLGFRPVTFTRGAVPIIHTATDTLRLSHCRGSYFSTHNVFAVRHNYVRLSTSWSFRPAVNWKASSTTCHSSEVKCRDYNYRLSSSFLFFSTLAGQQPQQPSPQTQKHVQDHSQGRGEKLRIAIVGGGAAGLTTALHLAPLAASGIIASPIDLYETVSLDSVHPSCLPSLPPDMDTGDGKNDSTSTSSTTTTSIRRNINDPHFHPGSGAIGRNIGVGIWSTALQPLAQSNRITHCELVSTLEQYGKYVNHVGYKTPNGKWLVTSSLNTCGLLGDDDDHHHNDGKIMNRKQHDKEQTKTVAKEEKIDINELPALLMLREKDLLRALREAVQKEEYDYGTIRTHYGPSQSTDGHLGGDTGKKQKQQQQQQHDGPTRVETICIPTRGGRIMNDYSSLSEPSIGRHQRQQQYSPSAAAAASSSWRTHGLSGILGFHNGTFSSPDQPYHVIVAADGMNSTLRSRYAGHYFGAKLKKQLTGFGADPPGSSGSSSSTTTTTNDGPNKNQKRKKRRKKRGEWDNTSATSMEWGERSQDVTNAIEDRQYTVFRGNAPLTNDQVGMDGVSFQTWGEGKSMRFASVPFCHPVDNNDDDDESSFSSTTTTTTDTKKTQRVEKQVWFITTSDSNIGTETCPIKRKDMLLSAFATWHDPIRELIASTPPQEILMERAVAHKHSVGPVLNMSKVLQHERELRERSSSSSSSSSSKNEKGGEHNETEGGAGGMGVLRKKVHSPSVGPGPVLVFVGDASMTVDPVLAQGFTIAMEDGYDLAQSIKKCCYNVELIGDDDDGGGGAKDGGGEEEDDDNVTRLAFDPDALRTELRERHQRRSGRLLCLLRATELVQSLAQPDSRTISGFLSRRFIRPVMKMTPDFVKRPFFNYMMRYSLGLLGGKKSEDTEQRGTEGEKR